MGDENEIRIVKGADVHVGYRQVARVYDLDDASLLTTEALVRALGVTSSEQRVLWGDVVDALRAIGDDMGDSVAGLRARLASGMVSAALKASETWLEDHGCDPSEPEAWAMTKANDAIPLAIRVCATADVHESHLLGVVFVACVFGRLRNIPEDSELHQRIKRTWLHEESRAELRADYEKALLPA